MAENQLIKIHVAVYLTREIFLLSNLLRELIVQIFMLMTKNASINLQGRCYIKKLTDTKGYKLTRARVSAMESSVRIGM